MQVPLLILPLLVAVAHCLPFDFPQDFPVRPPGRPCCIRNCNGIADGSYHTCTDNSPPDCYHYARCINGQFVDLVPCPPNTKWDDLYQTCQNPSSTCGACPPPPTERPTQPPPTTAGPTATPPPGDCVSDCAGLCDGEYQSCHGCEYYVTCHGGVINDKRPCAPGLVWDDLKKRCDFESDTCKGSVGPTVVPPVGKCVDDCTGIADGNYQSCSSCDTYVTCNKGTIDRNRKCPENLFWDDVTKSCEHVSSTCGGTTTPPIVPPAGQCVDDCRGIKDGDYQSCSSCDAYVTCYKGTIDRNRKCPENLFWDDKKKQCEHVSSTCGGTGPPPIVPPVGQCVTDCKGIADGDYQSCTSCDTYVTCYKGQTDLNRKCPDNLFWDDKAKQCVFDSTTCAGSTGSPPVIPPVGHCVDDCKGIADGDYQSCSGCDVYVTCYKGTTDRNRKCPDGLFWDDSVKQCVFDSTTCGGPTSKPPVIPPVGQCVDDCTGIADGNYQSCSSCDTYVTCHKGNIDKNRKCPPGLNWDDSKKRCEHQSTTCGDSGTSCPPVVPKPGECINSCYCVPNGNYQSCQGCNYYVNCDCGRIRDRLACPSGLYWDDYYKKCMYDSGTCNPPPPPSTTARPPPTTTTPSGSTDIGSCCINSCNGLRDGNYPSCVGCEYYASCIGGNLNNRLCPSGMEWDNDIGRCSSTSSTCDQLNP